MVSHIDDTTYAGAAWRSKGELPRILAGRFQVQEVLGEGGMGVVCRGFDLDLEESVAIKFLRGELVGDDAVRTRFRREVKLARRVTHPNVARVFEFGRDGPLQYLTMEFVAGESMQELLDREAPLGPERTLALAIGLCAGLAAAHAAGVVHGDIKPANVLVAPGRGAVLTDFGISRALSEEAGENGISGTPLYMAPEQARGEGLTTAVDVFAVGVVLFEALTGLTPWPVEDIAAMIQRRRDGHRIDLEDMSLGLSSEWARLIGDCLRWAPEQRPRDAGVLLARLHALTAAAPVAPSELPAAEPLATGSGARWIAVSALAAPAELAWISTDIIAALARIRGLRVLAGAGDTDTPVTARIDGQLTIDDTGVTAAVRVIDGPTGRVRAEFELHRSRELVHRLGPALAERIAGALDRVAPPPTIDDSLDVEGNELYLQARQAYATLRFEQAQQLFEAALARAPDSAMLRRGLTLARVQAMSLSRTGGAQLVAMKASVEAAIREHDGLGEPHLALARIQIALGDMSLGARSLCAALGRSPSLAEAYGLLGDLLIDIGRLPDAERRLDIAVALDSSSAHLWNSRARLWAYQGRWDEVLGAATQALTTRRFRNPLFFRLLLWRPDLAPLERCQADLAGNPDGLPVFMLEISRLLVAFGLAQGDRPDLLRRVEEQFFDTGSTRRNGLFAQLSAELRCMVGDREGALRAIERAVDRHALVDRQWLEHCPAIAPLQGEPRLQEFRERVRIRADGVAEAIWG